MSIDGDLRGQELIERFGHLIDGPSFRLHPRLCREGFSHIIVLDMPSRRSLTKAVDNHAALAAIAIFSSQELAPTPLPFYWSGNRAILVYDKENPDGDALQLAYAWARWVSRRELTGESSSIDIGRIEAALTKARQALQRHQSARACFSAATKKIDEGSAHVGSLVEEVRTAMSELWEGLNPA